MSTRPEMNNIDRFFALLVHYILSHILNKIPTKLLLTSNINNIVSACETCEKCVTTTPEMLGRTLLYHQHYSWPNCFQSLSSEEVITIHARVGGYVIRAGVHPYIYVTPKGLKSTLAVDSPF